MGSSPAGRSKYLTVTQEVRRRTKYGSMNKLKANPVLAARRLYWHPANGLRPFSALCGFLQPVTLKLCRNYEASRIGTGCLDVLVGFCQYLNPDKVPAVIGRCGIIKDHRYS